MLHRSCSFFSRSKFSYCHLDQLFTLKIFVAKRHASILITPRNGNCYKLRLPRESKRICHKESNFFDKRCPSLSITRQSGDDSKTKNQEIPKLVKELTQTLQQKIVELNGGEKLGKLRERILEVESVVLAKKIEAIGDKIEGKNEGSKDTEKKEEALKKAKRRVDHSASSLERNFITPVRAMSDFLLKPTDLGSLPKTKRRSPYEDKPPITVYWRKDVEAKAIEVWGSREALLKELLKKELELKTYQQNVFTVKRRLRDYRRELGNKPDTIDDKNEGLFGRSGRVVLTAVVINASNFLFKLVAWVYTGSHSMFSECIHSAADTFNQLILAYGIHKSVQNPNADHPYGYTNMKYVSSLISGVGIFCVGTGLSIYHGIHGILFPNPVESFYWAYFILGGSLVSEGATLLVAINSVRKGAEEKRQSFKDYVLSGQDPSVNVVLMEDLAAVMGVTVAGCCMGLTSHLGNPVFDAVGSLLVGGLLGGVASFIIYTNVAALIGRSIPQENLDKINAELESDVMVRAIYDVKGIDMGNSLVRYKAEIDFDGRELTRAYLDKHDLDAMLEEVKKMQSIDALEIFLLKHGENIVDMLGGEIDRIELKLKKNHPEIRHCDLEVL
ncbi:proton-coupled zinc antiporter SLC30A9, mitochondrial [Diachasmimorpha longicaudata]|uniref:proton-coupled zinc antiporter SLC30A9, mitochondrial n=1 Tax=Diachasmimorpha longicaudata TaxID=58733 RepID=UPI0030B8A30E